MAKPLIEFEDVMVLRDRTVALDRLSLRIDDGERVAILGPNGSGKSTLVEVLTRDVFPLAGRHAIAHTDGSPNIPIGSA